MPRFNIVRQSPQQESFKVAQVRSAFDLKRAPIVERFEGEIPIEGIDWNIGVIFGASGTGKTTIAKEVFPEAYTEPFTYGDGPIVDEVSDSHSYKEVTGMLTSVGFSSPPSWMKPYAVLSQGEKMRVDLARALLADKPVTLFDEFTSVVDRDVGKVCSMAIEKAVRRSGKQFIAVTCHEDIIPWLKPDWVYDTNSMTYTFRGAKDVRPEIRIKLYELPNARRQELWDVFRRYHYLSESISFSVKVFVGVYNGSPISFCAVQKFPHPTAKNIMRVSRLVVLPDYQGIGVGTRTLNAVAQVYAKKGYRVRIISSQIGFVKALKKRKEWALVEFGRKTRGTGKFQIKTRNCSSQKRVTGTFEYLGLKARRSA